MYIVVYTAFNAEEVYYFETLEQVKQNIEYMTESQTEIDKVRVFVGDEIDVKSVFKDPDYEKFINELEDEYQYHLNGGTSYRIKTAQLSLEVAKKVGDIAPFLEQETSKETVYNMNPGLDLHRIEDVAKMLRVIAKDIKNNSPRLLKKESEGGVNKIRLKPVVDKRTLDNMLIEDEQQQSAKRGNEIQGNINHLKSKQGARSGRNNQVNVTEDFHEKLNFKNCLCCGQPTLRTEIHDICDKCWWQDDPACWNDVDDDNNANGISLKDARINYEKYGTCDENQENDDSFSEEFKEKVEELKKQLAPNPNNGLYRLIEKIVEEDAQVSKKYADRLDSPDDKRIEPPPGKSIMDEHPEKKSNKQQLVIEARLQAHRDCIIFNLKCQGFDFDEQLLWGELNKIKDETKLMKLQKPAAQTDTFSNFLEILTKETT